MNKVFFIFLSFLFIIPQLVAEKKEGRQLIDSLLVELPNLGTDTNAINIYNELSMNYYFINPDSGLYYGRKALGIAKMNNWKKGVATSHNSIAANYWSMNKMPEAMEKYIKVLDIFEELGIKSGIAAAYTNIGMIYSSMDKYEKASEYYRKGIEMEKELGNEQSLARNYGNMGIVLSRSGKKDSALIYHFKSLVLNKKIGSKMAMSINFLNIGSIYLEDSVYTKAYNYNKKAMDIAEETDNKKIFALSMANVGNCYFLVYYNFEDIDEKVGFAFEIREDNLRKAIELLEKAKGILVELKDSKNLLEIHRHLLDAYLITPDFKKASIYRKAYESLSDSLMTEKAHSRIAQLDAEREVELMDKQLKIKELQISSQNTQIKIIIIALILIAIIAMIFLRLNNQKRKINAKLTEQRNIISEQNATKDKFFSIMAHDLRNPISSISQSINMLHKEFDVFDKDDIKEYIAGLQKSSKNLYALVEDLLTWSRSQRGMINANKEIYDARDIVTRAIDQVEAQAKNKNISIENMIPEERKVNLDASLTITILRNILSNAIKFSDFNSKIEVLLGGRNNGMLSIRVRDHGVGMDEKTMNSLFRIDAAHSGIGTAGEKGTGLGLIVCKEFAEKQGGDIIVESQSEEGSTFSLVFPDDEC